MDILGLLIGTLFLAITGKLYNNRLYDRYRHPIASMAVLADESESWHPTSFYFE